MADAPPPGPPPPRVPEGWKAVWNAQYNEWFFVNKFTKVSQWDKPTEPAIDPNAHGDSAPSGAPPGYASTGGVTGPNSSLSNEKHNPNNPYNSSAPKPDPEADARYAAQLQAEENARAANRPTSSSARGASDTYYQSPPASASYGQQSYPQNPTSPTNYGQQAAPQQDGKRGFLSKLMGKASSSSGSRPPQQYQQGGVGGYGPGAYGQQAYPPQGQQYGGYPQQQYYGGQQQYAQPPRKSGGMGMGGMALGAGAGLIGGALLMDAIDDHQDYEQQQAYDQGEQDGYQDGMDGGGGDDMGGGDF